VAEPDSSLFDTICRTCHAESSSEFSTGQKLKTVLNRARESQELAEREMARVGKRSPKAIRFRSRLQQARAYLIEALPVQHSLAIDRVEDLTRSSRSISEEVWASVHGIEEERHYRIIGLGFVWVFVLFVAAVAYLYKKEKQKSRARDAEAGGSP
jgi:hypothetical protein